MKTKRPVVTIALITVNIIVYLMMTFAGGSTNPNTLIAFGAKDNALIAAGQTWRLFTAMFLHIGFEHITLNMITLYFLGSQIEYLFGAARYLVIYFVSGVGGNLASFAFNPDISAGASTALFGLFGAYLMLGDAYRHNPYIHVIAKQFLILVILNLIGDFSGAIDIWGHIGGLITGFLMGYTMEAPRLGEVSSLKHWLSLVLIVILFVSVYNIGMQKF